MKSVLTLLAALLLVPLAALHAAAAEETQPNAVTKPMEFIRTGWNAQVRQQFVYPPILTYTRLEGAANYRCMVSWKDATGNARTSRLESAVPEFDLVKVWEDLPTVAVQP